MYVKQNTWLENGPRPSTLATCGVRSRGIGNILTAPVDCKSWWSLLDPAAWALCLPSDVGTTAGNIYESVQYGAIPKPASPPAPNAPQTAAEMVNWSPEQSASRPGQIGAATQAAIDGAIQSGTYNPSGNLPVTADWMSDHSALLWFAGFAVLGVVLVRKAVR